MRESNIPVDDTKKPSSNVSNFSATPSTATPLKVVLAKTPVTSAGAAANAVLNVDCVKLITPYRSMLIPMSASDVYEPVSPVTDLPSSARICDMTDRAVESP